MKIEGRRKEYFSYLTSMGNSDVGEREGFLGDPLSFKRVTPLDYDNLFRFTVLLLFYSFVGMWKIGSRLFLFVMIFSVKRCIDGLVYQKVPQYE